MNYYYYLIVFFFDLAGVCWLRIGGSVCWSNRVFADSDDYLLGASINLFLSLILKIINRLVFKIRRGYG